MRVRHIVSHNNMGHSSQFNMHAIAEIIVGYDDEGGMDSEYIKDWEVLLSNGEWKPLSQAFKDKNVITDNYNTRFREPLNQEEKDRGWFD